MNDKKHLSEDLAPAVSMPGETHLGNVHTEDAVFGTITEDGPNYRNVRSVPFLCITRSD